MKSTTTTNAYPSIAHCAWALAFAFVFLASPHIHAEDFSMATLQYMPDAMIDTVFNAESAVGNAYWRAVVAYTSATRSSLNAASALYMQGVESFVDATYGARDLSAAAYGGTATAYVNGITSIHDSQVATMQMMGNSMAEGAVQVGAAYSALVEWFGRGSDRIEQRLKESPH